MASLLGWLGGAAKRVGNTINNDVLQPINRDVIKPGINIASRSYDQLNPIDSGRSFTNRTPQVNTPVGGTIANFGKGVVQGTGLPWLINQDIVNPLKESLAIVSGNHTAEANASKFYNQPIGQQFKQLGGNAAGAALTLAAPGTSSAIEGGLGKLLGENLAVKALGGGLSGAAIGAPFNVASLAQQGAPLTAKNIKTSAIQGAEFGGALGVAAPLLSAGAKAGIKQFKGVPLTEEGLKARNAAVVGYNEAIAKGNPASAEIYNRQIQALDESTQSPIKRKIPNVSADEGVVGKNLNQGAFSAKDRANLEKQITAEQTKLNSGETPKIPSQDERLKMGNPEKNPLYGKVGVPAAQDAAQAHFNADFVAKNEKTVGQRALNAVNQLSKKDQDLMKQVQTKGTSVASQAENPAQFKQTLSAVRQYYDLRHAYDHYLGSKTPYRENYLRDLVERNSTDAMPLSGSNQAPGYTKAKTQAGYTNVAEALQRDINGSSYNHAKLTYTKGLDEAYPGQIQAGKPYTDANTQLQTPFGKELFAPKDLAKQINDRAPVPKSTGVLGKYDSANAFLKYAKLSGGAFHAFTETGNFVGQQLMSGKLFTEPSSTGKIFKVMFSDKAMKGEVAKLAENGTLDKANIGGLTWTPSEIKADVNVTPTGKIAKYTGIEGLHDATFKRDIPYAKLKTFEQATQGLDVNNPADLVKIRAAAKGVNEGYGGINRIADGFTPKQAKVLARGVLATDFTEGKMRTVLAAISKGGPEGKIARQLIAGKVLLFAGLATAGGALSGEYQGKSPTQVAENILGNFVNPTFKAGKNIVSFPATHISEFGKPLTPLFKDSTNKFSGIKDYASNRLAALPSEVNQLINNKDYGGQRIYGNDYKSNGETPISPAKTAVNIGKGALPIPASQGIAAAQGLQGIPATAANIVGLKVRPDTSTPTNVPVTGANQSPAAQEKAASNELAALKNRKDTQGATLQKLSNGKYAYTLDGDPEPHQADTLKKAQQAVAADMVGKSGDSYKVIGDTVYRKSPDGTVTPTPKIKFDYQVGTATLTAQKNAGDVNGWLDTANKQLQSIQKQLQDPNIDPLDSLTLQNDAAALQKNIDKYTGYGGFTKPKSGKAGRASAVSSFKTASNIKIAQPKGVTVKKLAAPNFKTTGTKKLAVSKIPSSYLNRKLA